MKGIVERERYLRSTAHRSVRVRRHRISWSSTDALCEITRSRITNLGDCLKRGCRFFVPGYSVLSPYPSPEFFWTVDRIRRTWLGALGACPFGLELDQIRRESFDLGQRDALEQLEGREPLILDLLLHPETTWKQLPPAQRRLIRRSRHDAYHLAMTGKMFIDGIPVNSGMGQWKLAAIDDPAHRQRIRVVSRKLDLNPIRRAGTVTPLAELTRSEIQSSLGYWRDRSFYINARESIEAPVASAAFLQEAAYRRTRWRRSAARVTGDSQYIQASLASDPADYMLVYEGVLYMNGAFFHPDCWPSLSDLRRSLDPLGCRREPSYGVRRPGEDPTCGSTATPDLLRLRLPDSSRPGFTVQMSPGHGGTGGSRTG